MIARRAFLLSMVVAGCGGRAAPPCGAGVGGSVTVNGTELTQCSYELASGKALVTGGAATLGQLVFELPAGTGPFDCNDMQESITFTLPSGETFVAGPTLTSNLEGSCTIDVADESASVFDFTLSAVVVDPQSPTGASQTLSAAGNLTLD